MCSELHRLGTTLNVVKCLAYFNVVTHRNLWEMGYLLWLTDENWFLLRSLENLEDNTNYLMRNWRSFSHYFKINKTKPEDNERYEKDRQKNLTPLSTHGSLTSHTYASDTNQT